MTPTNRLNVIQITTHDTGRRLGCYGHPTVHTPAIDGLAADGVRMTNYFAAAPICCASRAAMMTGRYPQSNGLFDLCFEPFNWRLNDDEIHLAGMLASGGYHTALFGFQHEVARNEIDRLGFETTRLTDKLYPCDHISREFIDFLSDSRARERPFFAQIGFFETHTPFDFGGATPDTSAGITVPAHLVDDESSRSTMAAFQGALRKADDAIGAILDALRRSGLEERTLVVFTTDHGIEVPRAKWTLYDAGIGIALVLRCPALGMVRGAACPALASNVDYVSTILDALGLPASDRLEGRSMLAAINKSVRGEPVSDVHDAVFSMYHKTQARSVRTRRYKLIQYFDAAVDFARVPVALKDVLSKRGISSNEELFDLDADPEEFQSLTGTHEHALDADELRSRLWRWMEDVDDPLLRGPMASPSYNAGIKAYRSWKVDSGKR